jgi:hypothetical protein
MDAATPVTQRYFKYRKLFTDENRNIPDKHTHSLIAKRNIYYAAPASFNDPLDCRLSFHVENTTEIEWKEYIRKLIDEYPNQRQALNNFMKNREWTSTLFDLSKTQEELYQNSSVLCLSSKGNSIPMFSYYADNHRGVAVEISFTPQETPCGFSYQQIKSGAIGGNITSAFVTYLPEAPELNYLRLRGTPALVKNAMFTKFIEWQHENEFRIFRKGIAPSSVQLEDKMITRIIFGERASERDVELVKEWIADYKTTVLLSKIRNIPNSYSLVIEDFA